ncbi:MAG: putative quinol monooxygenase [Pseudomonadota bacterium]
MSYVVIVRLRIRPEHLSVFMPLVKTNACISLNQEPGCQQFDVLSDGDRRGEILLYEVYADRASFDLHLASEHFLLFDAASAHMVASKTVETWRELHA